MKKVININFKGRVIPIEEAAFEQLQGYIESLRRYFANEEGRDEIINDIEDRIAELFNEELKKGATCITEESIVHTLNSMGRVEDFEQMDQETGASNGAGSSATTATAAAETHEPRGNITRNSNDKILGGVCSGLAHYLRIDPTVVRVLFALITLGGFGAGVLIYIIMWIVLPAKPLQSNIKKRLFRNPDEKVVGGVAGGLAAFFNIPVWLPRLVFVLPFVMGVFSSIFHNTFFDFEPVFITGGFGGTIFITYIVLWIVLPLANTPTEKLQMRGEKIDVNSIKNAVQEEMGGVKERVSEMGDQFKKGAERMGGEAKVAAQNFASAATPVATRVGSGLGNAIGILFKAFFMFIAAIFALVMLVLLIGATIAGVTVLPLKDFVFEGSLQNLSVWGTLFLFLFVPVIGLLIWVIRRVIGVKSRNPYLGYIFGGLWFFGWVALMILLSSFAKNFRTESWLENNVSIAQPQQTPLTVKVTEPALRYSGTFWWMDTDDEGWDITEDTLKYSNVKVRIEKSTDTGYGVKLIRYSYGQNRKDAEQRAGKIDYFITTENNQLLLSPGLAIDKESKFRGQKVMVLIKMPVGKKIRFDESVATRLHPFNIRMRDNGKWNRYNREYDFDFDNYFDYDTNVDYIMTEDGLRKLDKQGNIIQEEKKSSDWEDQNEENKVVPDSNRNPGNQPDTQRYRYKEQNTQTRKEIVEHTPANNTFYQPLTVNAL